MKKRYIFVACLCSLNIHAQTTSYDLNADGAVNMADASLLLKHLNNRALEKLDLNSDGAGNMQDLTILTDYILGRHQYVDLGLSVKWATCNVGASEPSGYGCYFAWGETQGYSGNVKDGRKFDWANYKWMESGEKSWTHCTKYTYEDDCVDACWYADSIYIGYQIGDVIYKNTTTLFAQDDAATVNWGDAWRMPTSEEWKELETKCTWTQTTLSGVKGFSVTGTNGNSIFLPMSGYRDGGVITNVGSIGDYWSSSLCQSCSAYATEAYFYGSTKARIYSYRRYGHSVRAVCE